MTSEAGSGSAMPKADPIRTKVYNGHCIIASCEIDDMPGFRCRDEDIWVCSFPRSATKLTQQLVYLTLDVEKYKYISGTTLTQQMVYLIMMLDVETGRTVQLDDRFPMADCVEPGYPYFRGLKHLDALPETSPRFIKCHLPYNFLPDQLKSGKGKIIYITRNPKASVVSFHKVCSYMKIIDVPLRQYVEDFLDGKTVLGAPWDKHFRSYWEHKDDPNVLFIQFETLVKDRPAMITKMADFLGKELSPAEIDTVCREMTLESMRSNNAVNFMYFEEKFTSDKSHGGYINKGDNSGWRRDLPEDLSKKFDQMIQHATADTDIVFE